MSNKQEREQKEVKNLFADKKFARDAWRSVGQAILQRPATKAPVMNDKEGNPTYQSLVDGYSYDTLAKDVKELCKEDRQPTQLEMIMQGQILKARYDTGAAIFVRDTLGAKPIDESRSQVDINNPYEELTDDELLALAEIRKKKANNER